MLAEKEVPQAKKSELRKTFEELCYVSKITQEDVEEYLSALKWRISDIEKVIDGHISIVKE